MIKKIGDICEFLKKSSLQAGEGKEEGAYPFYTTSEGATLFLDTYQYEGDCILIGIGGRATCRFVQGKFSSSMHNYVLKAKQGYNPKYIVYCLQNDGLRLLNNGFKGSGLKCIKKQYIEKIEIPIVDRKTQDVIVDELDKITHQISLDTMQLKGVDELIIAKYNELFGDPIINEKKWNLKPLMDIGACKNGMNFAYDESGIKINCLGVGDFKNKSLIDDTSILPQISLNNMPSNEYLLKNGDIVFVRSNGNKALVGRSLMVFPKETPTTFSGFCIRFRNNSKLINNFYLLHYFKHSNVRTRMLGRGANIQNLNQQILSRLQVPIPPLELQNIFEKYIKELNNLKVLINNHIELLNELLNKEMYKYFG